MHGDLLSVVEAAYAEAKDPEDWLDRALAAVEPHLNSGEGVLAHRFAHTENGVWRGAVRGRGQPEWVIPFIASSLEHVPEPMMQAAYPCVPRIALMTELVGTEGRDRLHAALKAEGNLLPIRDSLGLITGDPSGHGCVFFTMDSRSRHLSRHARATWDRLAAHLATGYRLARRPPVETDAVLDPVGKVLHLENGITPEQRDSLSEGTRAIDKARGKLRRVDPDRALSLWQALVDGRWSLVEHFDHDGKRFVVARRNSVPLRPWHALTEREVQTVAFTAEGQTLKLVAYQLGVSIATVSRDLQRAQHKLGVRSRLDLASAFRERGRRAHGGPSGLHPLGEARGSVTPPADGARSAR